jgi:glycosyltransferase involved in cell wall biosynthesis
LKILTISIHFGPPFQQEMMRAAATAGHEVVFYSAGWTNVRRKIGLRWTERDGIPEAQLLNSGIVAGTSMDPSLQCGSSHVDAITEEVLDRVKPDVVHVHELQAHGLSTLDVLRRRKVPYVVSVHNYWWVCPQLNLIAADGVACHDYNGGEKCTRCRLLPEADSRAGVEFAKSIFTASPLFQPLRRLRQRTRRLLSKGKGSVAPNGWSEPRFAATDFARRRALAVEGLNAAAAVHVMSTRTRMMLESYGVDAERIRVIPITLKRVDALQRAKHVGGHPVTFGYRGLLSYAKGVHVLLAAFATLDQTRARLVLHGAGEPEYEAGLRTMAKALNVEFRGEYDAARIQEIDSEIDVGVVSSLSEETFCLTGLEFLRTGTPVIASRLGGMVDYIRPDENGWLVPPGDVAALAARMQSIVDEPELAASLDVSAPDLASMPAVAGSILNLYRNAN